MFGGWRGSSCSTSNRAQRCKTCGVLLRKKAKYEQEKAQSNNDVLSSEDAASLKSVYSVRVQDQGPDYRCFVRCATAETASPFRMPELDIYQQVC